MGATKILLIDDHADHLAIMSEALRFAGYEVLTASAIAHGFALARAERPDLIVCDLHFNGHVEGIDLVTALRVDEATRTTPLLVYSAFIDYHAHVLQELDVRYLMKRGISNELLDTVKALLLQPLDAS